MLIHIKFKAEITTYYETQSHKLQQFNQFFAKLIKLQGLQVRRSKEENISNTHRVQHNNFETYVR